jgi:hypothetical protein
MTNQIEKAASNVIGAVRSAKATVEHISGIFRWLASENGEVIALIEMASMTADPEDRRELFNRRPGPSS